MQPTTLIEYANQLIQLGYTDEARSTLASLLQADPNDASAWALSAWVAPDSERCAFALRQVVEHSHDTRLSGWAGRGLVLVEHTGALGEEPPPVLAPAQPAPVQPASPATPPLRGPGYNLSQAGGGVMIVGILILILVLVSQSAADLISATGVSPGTCGLGLIAIGAILAYVGYQQRQSS